MAFPFNKEKEGIGDSEQVPLAERKLPQEVSGELKEHIRILKEDIVLPQSVSELGATVVSQSPSLSSQPAIVLPLSNAKIHQVLHLKMKDKIGESLWWMAVWCLRLIDWGRKHGRKIIFKNDL